MGAVFAAAGITLSFGRKGIGIWFKKMGLSLRLRGWPFLLGGGLGIRFKEMGAVFAVVGMALSFRREGIGNREQGLGKR
jgi:hypothetical protein